MALFPADRQDPWDSPVPARVLRALTLPFKSISNIYLVTVDKARSQLKNWEQTGFNTIQT